MARTCPWRRHRRVSGFCEVAPLIRTSLARDAHRCTYRFEPAVHGRPPHQDRARFGYPPGARRRPASADSRSPPGRRPRGKSSPQGSTALQSAAIAVYHFVRLERGHVSRPDRLRRATGKLDLGIAIANHAGAGGQSGRCAPRAFNTTIRSCGLPDPDAAGFGHPPRRGSSPVRLDRRAADRLEGDRPGSSLPPVRSAAAERGSPV